MISGHVALEGPYAGSACAVRFHTGLSHCEREKMEQERKPGGDVWQEACNILTLEERERVLIYTAIDQVYVPRFFAPRVEKQTACDFALLVILGCTKQQRLAPKVVHSYLPRSGIYHSWELTCSTTSAMRLHLKRLRRVPPPPPPLSASVTFHCHDTLVNGSVTY